MTTIDPRQQLVNTLHEQGRHGEALSLLQEWYAEAEQALEPDRSHYFMPMFQWKLLAEDYPPARTALAAARDEQATRLLAGAPYTGRDPSHGPPRDLFRRMKRFSLIVDMNRTLGDPHATHALFLQLEAGQPELARRHAWEALPAIVEAGDFALADRYRGDPLDRLDTVRHTALTWPLFPPPRTAPRLCGELMNLTGDVRVGVAVLRGLGRGDEATALRETMLAALDPGPLRDLAERDLDEPGTISRELVVHQMAQEDRAAQH
jgi:hypothetical protein